MECPDCGEALRCLRTKKEKGEIKRERKCPRCGYRVATKEEFKQKLAKTANTSKN